MPKLPRVSGDKVIQTFNHLGFGFIRQKGSHVILRRGKFGCVIPLKGLLAGYAQYLIGVIKEEVIFFRIATNLFCASPKNAI